MPSYGEVRVVKRCSSMTLQSPNVGMRGDADCMYATLRARGDVRSGHQCEVRQLCDVPVVLVELYTSPYLGALYITLRTVPHSSIPNIC
jgi:hypothetical protein